MPLFIDRQEELNELNTLLSSIEGGESSFVIVYGRRRVGKTGTTLLLHWDKESGLPHLYWIARREPAEATRQSLARALWRWAYPDIQESQPPRFDSRESLFE